MHTHSYELDDYCSDVSPPSFKHNNNHRFTAIIHGVSGHLQWILWCKVFCPHALAGDKLATSAFEFGRR